MLLRLAINLARWSWGYPSWVIPKEIDPDVAVLMTFGFLLDATVLVGIIGLLACYVVPAIEDWARKLHRR